MKKKDLILAITIAVLLIAGVLLLCISMFGTPAPNHHPLPISMSCIVVANALVVYKSHKNQKKDYK